MEGVVEDDDRRSAGGGARDLDRVLDRLGAGVDEQGLLLVAAARRELGEPPADVDVRLVHADHEALVQVAVDLLVDGRDGGGQAVAGVLAARGRRRSRCSCCPSTSQMRAPSARATTSGGVATPAAT